MGFHANLADLLLFSESPAVFGTSTQMMAWLESFRRRDENTRSCWGYTFQLTPEHLTPDETHHLKFSYDTLAEQALEKLNNLPTITNPLGPQEAAQICRDKFDKDSPVPQDPGTEKRVKFFKRDLYALLRDNAHTDASLNALWTQANSVPSWVNWDQVARGQDVFYRYGAPALTGLAFQSLLGGLVRKHCLFSVY